MFNLNKCMSLDLLFIKCIVIIEELFIQHIEITKLLKKIYKNVCKICLILSWFWWPKHCGDTCLHLLLFTLVIHPLNWRNCLKTPSLRPSATTYLVARKTLDLGFILSTAIMHTQMSYLLHFGVIVPWVRQLLI